MNFLIETSTFNPCSKKLAKIAKEYGFKVKNIPFNYNNLLLDLSKIFPNNSNTIYYGSLSLGLKIKKEISWNPGVYCNLPNFKCSYYWPLFKGFLLNENYKIVNSKLLNINEPMFIRPDSGFKYFTGKVFTKDEVERLSLLNDMDIVISEPKIITDEWRLVVSNKVITGSRYSFEKENHIPPQEVVEFGQFILDNIAFRPDYLWTLDICKTDNGELKVVEANSFSCAGLYNADLTLIIKEIKNELATNI